jgi:hypothetical protein
LGGKGRWNREGAGVGERSTEMLTDSAYSVQVSVEQMLFLRDVAVSIAGFRLKSKLLGAHSYRRLHMAGQYHCIPSYLEALGALRSYTLFYPTSVL